MNIFTINIVVETKQQEFRKYDEVALNKFPIIVITNNIDEDIINNDIWDYINNTIHTKIIYDSAKFFIRYIDENNNIVEQIKKLTLYKSFDNLKKNI